ncbi:hypothetical protein SETIT_6G000300v2 [Setaria italica]|uniref:Uncharacterized protein n=1 Tax=Setaria italica TaxID=4555 RepID=A0A368RGF7_SETIT|nr:hypothetical protein SETIT_6G000300v2 [Setaria italica]
MPCAVLLCLDQLRAGRHHHILCLCRNTISSLQEKFFLSNKQEKVLDILSQL